MHGAGDGIGTRHREGNIDLLPAVDDLPVAVIQFRGCAGRGGPFATSAYDEDVRDSRIVDEFEFAACFDFRGGRGEGCAFHMRLIERNEPDATAPCGEKHQHGQQHDAKTFHVCLSLTRHGLQRAAP